MGKKIILAVLAVLALGVAGLVIAAMTQPDTYRVERSRTLAAAPGDLTPHLHDLRHFAEWSPWTELDPNMTQTYSDPSSGVDAWYEWNGNDDVGRGRMTVTRADDDGVSYHIEFMEPFASEADTTISLVANDEGGTVVTWAMDAQNNFMGKLAGLFMDMDAMIGADFERGLGNLAQIRTGS